jgi:hypothetical protein
MKKMIVTLGCLSFWAVVIGSLSGCGQIFGVQHVDLWGAKMDFNSGFEVKAGAMQYDHALERRGINVEQRDNRKLEKY